MQVMNSLTEGAVINVGDASVPFVTSQRAHFNVVLFFWDTCWCILLDRWSLERLTVSFVPPSIRLLNA